jgi:hypothetical protein
LLTRQFLPGYFHSPLSGLDRVSPHGIVDAAEPPTASAILTAFV